MMKKFVCMILAMIMALSLVACGNKEEKVVSTDGSTSMQKVINALGEAFMEETGAKSPDLTIWIKVVTRNTCKVCRDSVFIKHETFFV